MKISVLIAMYNAEEYIEKTLVSILEQSYPVDEIIVIDDKSRDLSVEKVLGMSNIFPQIKLYTQKENQGVSATRNTGLNLVTNEWVLLMDADDIAHKELLKKEVRLLKEVESTFPSPVAIHPAYVQIDELENVIPNSEFRSQQYSFDDLQGSLFVRNHIITSSGMLINKLKVLELGGYKTDLSISEDVELYLRLAGVGTFFYVDEILISYRRHLKNASSNIDKVSRAGKSILELYSIDEIRHAILKRSFSEEKNILDYVTVLYQYGEFKEGFKELQRLPAKECNDKKLFLTSIYYIEMREWSKAEKVLKTLVEIDANNGAALNNSGVISVLNKEFEIAESLFERALLYYPGYMDTINNLKYLKEGIGNLKFTKRELRKNLLRYT